LPTPTADQPEKQFCGHRTDSDNRYAKKAHPDGIKPAFRMLHNRV